MKDLKTEWIKDSETEIWFCPKCGGLRPLNEHIKNKDFMWLNEHGYIGHKPECDAVQKREENTA